MEQAWGVIQEMSADEREREAAEAAEKARRDMVSRIRYAESKARAQGHADGRADGLEEGIGKGRAEEQSAIVSYMLGKGHSTEEIILRPDKKLHFLECCPDPLSPRISSSHQAALPVCSDDLGLLRIIPSNSCTFSPISVSISALRSV